MPKKIFELAKELEMGALDLVEELKSVGLNVRNHMSTLSDDDVLKALSHFKKDQKSGGSKKRSAAASSASSTSDTKDPIKKDRPVRKKAAKKAAPIPENVIAETPVVSAAAATIIEENIAPSVESDTPINLERENNLEQNLAPSNDQDEKAVSKEAEMESNLNNEEVSINIGNTKIITVKKRNVVLRRKHEIEHNLEQKASAGQKVTEISSNVPPIISPHKAVSSSRIDEEIPKLKGLQVVYRPEKVQEVAPPVTTKTDEGKNKNSKDGKKEFLEVKMHSFTPVYIPPKPTPEEIAAKKAAQNSGVITRKKPVGTAEAADDAQSKEDALKLDSKKRIGGLAAMVAKPKVAKTRDIVQFRADEELKVYAQGVIGKVSYTNVGKKKIYSGPTKSTELTEIKDSKRVLAIHEGVEAKELSNKLGVKFSNLQEQALDLNLLLKSNDFLGPKLAEKIADLYRYKVVNKAFQEDELLGKEEDSSEEDLRPERAPVVAVMGHVDHGKTTLLDAIRKAKVVNTEAGGITQHLGAYSVIKNDKPITFLDTPGHAAFSAMRERGAKATDVVILVVAADDGVMPQTKESIKFCQDNNVPVVVAINKMDKEGVNPDRIKQELVEFQLTPEEWGGETQFVEVSALKSEGIEKLLDAILLQSEMLELKADPDKKATGVVLESKIESGRGPVCTLLIQEGTLNKGDSIIAGESYGRARSLIDQDGVQQKTVGPSQAIQVIGLESTPNPGEEFYIVKSEREAKKIADNRIEKRKALENRPVEKITSLEDFFKQQGTTENKQMLKIILRADVMGSYEALKNALATIGNEDVAAEIIGGGAGPITDSDINLAKSSKGLVLAFNVGAVTSARRLSENLGVEIRSYRIIYDLINDVKLALEGLLAPVEEEKYLGRAQVREIFSIPKIGVIAGCVVQDGKVEKGCSIRLLRDGKIIHEGKIDSLKRFKDNVKEVKMGQECGISLLGYKDIRVQDMLEAYTMEQKKRTLEVSVMENQL